MVGIQQKSNNQRSKNPPFTRVGYDIYICRKKFIKQTQVRGKEAVNSDRTPSVVCWDCDPNLLVASGAAPCIVTKAVVELRTEYGFIRLVVLRRWLGQGRT